jgi:hypothetical protein
MSDDLDDKKFRRFLSEHRPVPSLNDKDEVKKIWNRIVVKSFNERRLFTPLRVAFATSAIFAMVVVYSIYSSPFPYDSDVFSAVEQTFNVEYEGEEVSEITDLLALAE